MNDRHIYKHVVVVGLDGMGVFNRLADTPCMDKIFADGAVTYSALSMSPTSSAENWGSMLLGASPEVHRAANELDIGIKHTGEAFPSVFKRIREALPDARLSSFVNWKPINRGMIEDGLDVNMGSAKDEELCGLIVDEIANKPNFLFIQFDEIDGAGHGSGYGSEDYLKKISIEDSFVGRIHDAYVKNGIIDDTLFIAVADHGGIITGHGAYSDEEKYIYLAASGKNVPKGNIGTAYTRDISAIVLYALGIDVPEYDEYGFSSQVPDGIFPEKTKKYQTVTPKDLKFQPRTAPAFRSENGLASYIPEEKIRLAVFMDGEIRDETGRNELIESGKIGCADGVMGKCGILGKTGHITVKDFAFGKGSFTTAFWGRIDPSIGEGLPICANKDWFWRVRGGIGFGIAFRAHDIIMNISDGKNSQEVTVGFPLEIGGGWLHVMHAVDKENRKIRVFFNFREVYAADLFENLVEAADTGLEFNIGNDALGTFSSERYDMTFPMDDFIIFNGALTSDDAEKIAEYYGMN